MPNLVVIAGPNGAGKSTLAPALLDRFLGLGNFVNADPIAHGLSGFDPERAAIQAGRIMLQRLRSLARQRADFAFETTLASRTFAPWITTLVQSGYGFGLIYIWVASPELCIARVAERVRMGGHHVPDTVVRRRYRTGLRNFLELYRPLADVWQIYDNSSHTAIRLIAEGHQRQVAQVYDELGWSRITQGALSDSQREA